MANAIKAVMSEEMRLKKKNTLKVLEVSGRTPKKTLTARKEL